MKKWTMFCLAGVLACSFVCSPAGQTAVRASEAEGSGGVPELTEGFPNESIVYSMEEQTVMEAEEGIMTITGYSADAEGLHVMVRCENTSGNEVLFGLKDSAVNRYMIDPEWAHSVSSWQTDNSEILFPAKDLEQAGISALEELTLCMQMTDFYTWEVFADEVVSTVYPTGKTEEEIVVPERVSTEAESAAADDENCSFILLGSRTDPDLGYVIDYYYENRTDKPQAYMLENCMLNGRSVLLDGEAEALPGCRGYGSAVIGKDELEGKGIAGIRKIQFRLQVCDVSGETPAVLTEASVEYEP